MRWLRRSALVLVSTLVAIELLLQVGAGVVWLLNRQSPATGEGSDREGLRTILCVGDSFTFGLGADDPDTGSYPAHLQRLLDEAQPDTWRVERRAWPGRNSRDLLERLPSQLAELAPEQVCIFVGTNDRWTWPEPLPEGSEGVASEPGSYRFELRTPRLIRVFLDQLRSAAERNAPNADPSDDQPDAAWSELYRGRLDRARQQFEELSARGEPAARLGLLELARLEGRRDDLDRILATLRQEFAATGSAEAAGLVLAGLLAAGDADGAAALAETLQPAPQPSHWRLDDARARLAWRAGDTEEVTRAMQAAIATVPDFPAVHRIELLQRAGALASATPRQAEALARAIETYRGDDDEEALRAALRAAPDAPELLYEVLWRLGARPDERRALAAVFADVHGWRMQDEIWQHPESGRWVWGYGKMMRWLGPEGASGSAVGRVYDDHLSRMIELCRNAGAHVLLLTYPRDDMDFPNQMVRSLAAQHGSATTLVDLQPYFADILTRRPYDELFIPDGHCRGPGYELLAREVLRSLRVASRGKR